LTEAASLATSANDATTAKYGPTHPNTTHIRQLRGYVAEKLGGHAAQLCVARFGATNEMTESNARHAAAAWQRIETPDTAPVPPGRPAGAAQQRGRGRQPTSPCGAGPGSRPARGNSPMA
jgi:hypothetical protein